MRANKSEGESEFSFFLRNLLSGATAACMGEFATLPLDTAKVRLQLQSKQFDPHLKPKYRGVLGTIKTMTAEEGFTSLYQGLSAGLQRQTVYAGLRIGLYLPVRNLVAGDLKPGENPSLLTKITAAWITGTIAISFANPMDVVKVRLQRQQRTVDPSKLLFRGTLDCYKKTIAERGFFGGLWFGWVPNIFRNSMINAAEIASYDQYKQMIM